MSVTCRYYIQPGGKTGVRLHLSFSTVWPTMCKVYVVHLNTIKMHYGSGKQQCFDTSKAQVRAHIYLLSPFSGTLSPAGIHTLSMTNKNEQQELPQRRLELAL